MIDPAYVQRMARYNRWQNANLYGVADTLPDEERRRERGAFFGSIHKTLSHLLWGDQVWMSRFTDVQRPDVSIPESASLYPDWEDLKQKRVAFDGTMIDWADALDNAALAGELSYYSRGAGRDMTVPKWCAVNSHVQSSDAPPRSGALHADAGGRQAAHDRPDRPAGVRRVSSAGGKPSSPSRRRS